MKLIPEKQLEDWTIFKYGWLAIFLIHIAFLAVGIHYLMTAYNMDHPDLLKAQALRGTYLIIAGYMMVIAFSVLLLVLAILIFEVFRSQRKILRKLDAMGIDADDADASEDQDGFAEDGEDGSEDVLSKLDTGDGDDDDVPVM